MSSPRDVHKSGPGGSDQVLHHVREIFKESYSVHACLLVATTQKREEWNHHPCSALVADTGDSDSNDEDSVMPPLIYSEDSDNKESPRKLPSTEPTLYPGPPSEEPNEGPTSKPNSDSLLEPSVPRREDSMGNLPPKEIVIYQKGSDPTKFATLEERTKEDPWGDTWKIRILGQDKSLEAGEDLLAPTESPYKIPTNLEELDKDVIGAYLTKKDMTKLWSTNDLLGWDERELLVWHHRMNHCYFKNLIRLSKRRIISRNLIKISPPPLVLPEYLEIPTRGHGGPKENTQVDQSGSLRIPDPGP